MSKKEFVGLSCITVGTGQGGTISMLARVSVVDTRGSVLYDAYVQPTSKVESYRFATTGLDATYFVSAVPFEEAQLTVARWLAGKIVVGHQLWLDLQVLGLPHPAVDTRDVSLYLPFRATLKRPNEILGLPTLVWHLMRRKIQAGFLDSAENARAAMDLYQSYEKQWEAYNKIYGRALFRQSLSLATIRSFSLNIPLLPSPFFPGFTLFRF